MLPNSRDDETLARLASSRGNLLRSEFTAFLDERTPLEVQALLPRLKQSLPQEARDFAAALPLMTMLGAEVAETFRHEPISPDVDFYHDPDIAVQQKSLVLTFAGSGRLLMMPTSLFLQHLPASRFDVVRLADPQNASYDLGIAGFEGPLPATMRALSAAVGASKYQRIYCYGTSMGGFPALKAGRLLGAERAIAIGGSFPWPMNRLLADPVANITSFDALCCCAPSSRTKLVVAFSGGFGRDVMNAETIRHRLPVEFARFDNWRKHNVAFELVQSGQFDRFLSRVLDFDATILHRPLVSELPVAGTGSS
jgi:hypothetical protein